VRRRSRETNALIPAETARTTTFLTAFVHSDEELNEYEPGAQSRLVGDVLVNKLSDAIRWLPFGDPIGKQFRDRWENIGTANRWQDHEVDPTTQWPRWWENWAGIDPDGLQVNCTQRLPHKEIQRAESVLSYHTAFLLSLNVFPCR